MLLKSETLQSCLVMALAFQSPWGEWLSIAEQERRLKRVRRPEPVVIPKPNGFRTLLAIDALSPWFGPDIGRLSRPAAEWFDQACEGGWFRLYGVGPSIQNSSIGPKSSTVQITSSRDIRHTAQALECQGKAGTISVSHVDPLLRLFKAQRKSGAWTYVLEQGGEVVFTTLSCLTLLDLVLKSEDPVFSLIRAERGDEIRSRRRAATRFLENRLLTDSELVDLFDVGISAARLFDVFQHDAPGLGDRLMSYLRTHWVDGGGRWVGRDHDDVIELYAILYSAFARGADLDDPFDVAVLAKTAQFLDKELTELTAGHDATTFLFALDGASTLLRRSEGRLPEPQSVASLITSKAYKKASQFVLIHALRDRLYALRWVLEHGGECREARCVRKREARYVEYLADVLSESPAARFPDRQALLSLRENLRQSRFSPNERTAHSALIDQLLAKWSESNWKDNLLALAKELSLELCARVIVKAGQP